SRFTRAACLREHAYIARTGCADDAGRPRRDVRHPAQRPRGAAARRVRGPAGTGVDRPDDGPVRPRVADARESVRGPRTEPEALPRGSEMGSRANGPDRRLVRTRRPTSPPP